MDSEGSTVWVRPKSVPIPTVWRRCEGRNKAADGKVLKFKIQDVTEDMHDEIIHLMCTIFLRDEHLCNSQRLVEDSVSVKEFEVEWRQYLKQNMALVALVDDDSGVVGHSRIAALNLTGVALKSDPESTYDVYKGLPTRNVMKFILDCALKPVNVFEHYGVDKYMSALGLLVLPEYRGQGLSVEILKARFDLGRAVGLKATMTYFSPTAAQRAAEKAGMEVLNEVCYDDYKEDGKVVFPHIKTKSFKVMGSVIR